MATKFAAAREELPEVTVERHLAALYAARVVNKTPDAKLIEAAREALKNERVLAAAKREMDRLANPRHRIFDRCFVSKQRLAYLQELLA